MARYIFLTSFAFILLSLTSALAQLPAPLPESKEEKEKAQKELERKALTLLDETLEGAQILKLAENRTLIQSQAADLLWKRDEKRARALFRDAMTELGTALNAAQEKASRRDNSYWMLLQARTQTIQMIAARDPRLALELLHATSPPQPENAEASFGRADQELMLEQSIAAQVAADDPKLALQMAEESLNKGVSFSTLGTLQRLQQKDADAASQLATDIVKKLQSESLTSKPETQFLALELLRFVLQPQAQREMMGMRAPSQAAEIKPLKLEEQTTRDLAEVVISSALTTSINGPGMLMQIQPLLPELEKLSPVRTTQLRRRITELDKTLDPQSRAWMQLANSMRSGTPDAMLEAASKAPPEMRGSLYSAAAMSLMQTGDTDKARQIITEHLSGQEREQALARLDRLVIMRAIEKGKLDEVKQTISGISSKERRASALAQLAVAVAAKGDKKGALQILDEARSLLDRQPDNDRELQALLEVARGYALVEPSRTFELLDPLVDQANEMIAAAALLEKFGAGQQGMFRKGEMLMLTGFANLGGPYAHFVKALTELSRVSFDRTRATADRFSRDEVRLMARLIVARSVLSDRPQKSNEPEEFDGFGGPAIIVGGF